MAEFGANEAESFVKTPVGIAETGKIGEMVGSEEDLGFFFGAEVDESDLRAQGFDSNAFSGEQGDRLAAERSTEVPQEDEKERRLVKQRRERLAGLRVRRAEQIRVEFFHEDDSLSILLLKAAPCE